MLEEARQRREELLKKLEMVEKETREAEEQASTLEGEGVAEEGGT